MKREFLNVRPVLLGFLLIFFLVGGSLAAQEEWEQWLGELDGALQGISMNVEEVADSFFDVFVETVLREGLPADVVDPMLGEALTSEEVTAIIREGAPELFRALGVADTTFGVVDLTPGAAVHKYDREGRWSLGPHRFEIQTWARVNQWIRASMSSSKFVWEVFKPGDYSTDCMYLNIHSNDRMTVTLENNGPLTNAAGVALPTAYALSEYVSTPPELVLLGRTMAGAAPYIDWVGDGGIGTATLGRHTLIKVWNYIRVSSEVSPGLYSTPNRPSAAITITAAGL